MNKLLTIGTLGAAGIVGAGLLTIPGLALADSATDEAAVKREDGVAELVLVDDDDDDDTADRSRTRDSRNSRAAGASVSHVAQDRQAPRDNTVSSVTGAGPTQDSAQDISRDSHGSNDASQDSRDVSDDANS